MEGTSNVSRARLESRSLGSDHRSIPRDPGDDLEAKTLLGALRGTRLSHGAAWDDEADARLRAFQSSVGLRATGRPDASTLEELAKAVETQRISALPTPAEVDHAELALKSVFHGLATTVESLAHDAPLRAAYAREVSDMSRKLLERFATGQMSLSEATHLAVTQRNLVMDATRKASGQVGAAVSKLLKEEGVTLFQAVERYAQRLFGKPAAKLTIEQLAKVQITIVERAGVTNARVNALSAQLPHVSRAMTAVAVVFALHAIATAENKTEETVTQIAGFAGGAAGMEAGAFLGGLVCGPPCAIVGALAGGMAGAYVGEEGGRAAYRAYRG